jgi:hypothetical protein
MGRVAGAINYLSLRMRVVWKGGERRGEAEPIVPLCRVLWLLSGNLS